MIERDFRLSQKLKRAKMNRLALNFDKYTVTSTTALAVRNSTIIAHRLSIYIPNLLAPSRDPQKLIVEINSQVALFRDMLIHIGQSKDSPELREKIRKLRRSCMEAMKHTAQLLVNQMKSAVNDSSMPPPENAHILLLYYLSQLFLRELIKSYRLIQVIPMDMSNYYENRAGPSNLGNVISQILLCKQITPDFNQEELCSITKDSQEIALLLAELQQYMPQQAAYLERNNTLETNAPPWLPKRRSSIYKNMSFLCCVSRPNYL